LVRFRNQNQYYLRFINRLIDPSSKTSATTTPNSPTKTTAATTIAPSCATEQYNIVLQPSESLILPVNGLSNDSPVKDNAAWARVGGQEACRLERIMDQHALVLTIHDVAYAAWKLSAVRSWIKALQKDYERQEHVVIKQEPGMAAQPLSKHQSVGGSQTFSMQNIVTALPGLLAELNDSVAISNLAAEIERAGDDIAAGVSIVGGSNKGEHAQQRKHQDQPDDLLSVISFSNKPSKAPTPPTQLEATLPSTKTTTADATIIKTEEPEHQAKTGPIGPANGTKTTTVPPSITKTTTKESAKQQANPPLPVAVTIKKEPLHVNQSGPPATATDASKFLDDKVTSKPLPLPQKATLPSKNAASSINNNSKNTKNTASTSLTAIEKKRKQDIDSAEKKRRAAISWQAQPSHPEDQPLLNNGKRKKKKTTPPAAETLVRIYLGTLGAGTNKPLSFTHLQRPSSERPRYITNANNEIQPPDATNPTTVAPIPRRWETTMTDSSGDNIKNFSGDFVMRPIPEISQAPPPGAGFSSWFDSMHEVEPTAPPPLDEDIDPSARITCTYFDEVNPVIANYGLLPEVTVKILAVLPDPLDEDVREEDPPPNSRPLQNVQGTRRNLVQPSSLIIITTGKHTKQQQHQNPPSIIEKTLSQKQQRLSDNKNAMQAHWGRRRSQSNDYPSDDGDDDDDYNYGEDYDDDYDDYESHSRRTYSQSRSRSPLPPQRNRQTGTRLCPPKNWTDYYKNDPNRPQVSRLQLERPYECIWQLKNSSRILRSSVEWQEKSFDPVWRYEMRLQTYLINTKARTATAELVYKEHPLPREFNQDFNTFINFISSRSHLFEIISESATGDHGVVPNRNALIRLRDRASPLLDWKRRMLDYVKLEGRKTGFRVPLAEVLLACPFPRDAPEEEIEDARSNIHSYIVSKLGDALYVIQPNMWTEMPDDTLATYPYVIFLRAS
jgi:hypothetical protein